MRATVSQHRLNKNRQLCRLSNMAVAAVLFVCTACNNQSDAGAVHDSERRPQQDKSKSTAKLSRDSTAIKPGIWVNAEELAKLPQNGPAWDNLLGEANKPTGTPDLSNQDSPVNVRVLAKALVYARTGEKEYREQVVAACMNAIGTEDSGKTLALGRELAAYVIAADLVSLPPNDDEKFRKWLQELLSKELDGKTLRYTHEIRPNNWGTHAGASRAAIAVYLNDHSELERTAQVFKGWLGDRDAYAGFEFGKLDWQANLTTPVGINPKGAHRAGHSIDGVLPDDQRRYGGFSWPPPTANYVYGALQGAMAQAVILSRAGYKVWDWEDRALLRAFQWLHQQANYAPDGDDVWLLPLVDYYYGTNFWNGAPTRPGKNLGWTDWTHGGR